MASTDNAASTNRPPSRRARRTASQTRALRASVSASADLLAQLDAFDALCCSADDFVAHLLLDARLRRRHASMDVALVESICCAYLNERRIVDAAVDCFMAASGGNGGAKSAKESERHALCVVAYWLLFRLDGRQWSLKHDVLSVFQPLFCGSCSLHRFVEAFFALDGDDFMMDSCTSAWLQVYDRDYIEERVLAPFLRARERAQALVLARMTKRRAAAAATPTTTTPQPFRLTPARPRPIYEVELLPRQAKATRFPKEMFERVPSAEARLEERRQVNALDAERLLNEARQNAPRCSLPKVVVVPPSEEEPKPAFVARPVPMTNSTPSDEQQKQVNRAALLRRNRIMWQKRERVLEQFEDASAAFLRQVDFSRRMEDALRDEAGEEALATADAHLQGMHAFEGALAARQGTIIANRLEGEQQRRERERVRDKVLQAESEEGERKRKQARQLQVALKDGVDKAMLRHEEEKRAQAQVVKMENDQLKLDDLQQREEEMQCRRELIEEIKQLKARTSNAANHRAVVDETTTPGYGLLSEMSLGELRERLRLLKMLRDQQRDEKRERIRVEQEAAAEAEAQLRRLVERDAELRRAKKQPSLAHRLRQTRLAAIANVKNEHPHYRQMLQGIREKREERRRSLQPKRKLHRNTPNDYPLWETSDGVLIAGVN